MACCTGLLMVLPVLSAWDSFLIVGVFVYRIAREDRMLREKLPGYAEYTEKVQYRLFPSVW